MRVEIHTPCKTHEFFQGCVTVFGVASLQKVFQRGRSAIYGYAEDPDLQEERRRNPLDRILHLMKRLVQAGRQDIAVAGARLIAEAAGVRVVERGEAVPDKATLHEELLDDLPALTRLHQAMLGGVSIVEVERLLDEAKRELNQGVAKYREEQD